MGRMTNLLGFSLSSGSCASMAFTRAISAANSSSFRAEEEEEDEEGFRGAS
jgi:hypothetical protein